MQQKGDGHESDDDGFLDQRAFQGLDRRLDQRRAVVDRDNLGTRRKAAFDGVEAVLGIVDHGQRVGSEPLQHDAACDLAFAIQLGDAAPLVRHEFHSRDVAELERHAVLAFQDDVLDIRNALQVAAAADHELELGQLDRAAASVGIAGADGIGHIVERDTLGFEPRWIDDDRILLDEAADARDLGDAFGLGHGKPYHPVL